MKNNFIEFDINEDCPVRNVLDRLGDKWSVLIILTLGNNNTLRFSQLQKAIGNVSQKMLTITLKTLEADGIVNRKLYAEVPLRVEYSLTERGRTLLPLLRSLTDWAAANMQNIVTDRKAYAVKQS